MSLFLPITKVDVAQRLVYGTISEEVPDKAGEILDYATAKPAFETWSRQFQEASNGKSLGNVRAMHGTVAAGKLTDIHYDDANRRIDGVAKIIDDDEWDKVMEGVYTGFSIGGGYARRWPDEQNPGLMRYTPVLSEVSLVDNPAVPTATFQVIKQDGSVEMRKFDSQDGMDDDADDETETDDGAPDTARLLSGLKWLAAQARAIGAAGLLAHIAAIIGYLEETDEGDAASTALPDAAKSAKQNDTQSLQEHIGALQKRVAELEAQPLPAKGVLRAVGKTEDRAEVPKTPAPQSPGDRVNELMKAALANPIMM
jgi:hypothetical protein